MIVSFIPQLPTLETGCSKELVVEAAMNVKIDMTVQEFKALKAFVAMGEDCGRSTGDEELDAIGDNIHEKFSKIKL